VRLAPLALLLLACGPAPTAPGDRGPSARAASDGLPATDRDPLPYTPPPEAAHGETGTTVALAASGGEDQARRLLPSLLRAVRDADERELEQLLADEVVVSNARRSRRSVQPRATVIQRLLIYARRSVLPADVRVAELVDLEHLEVQRAARHWERDMPEDVRPTDLVVEVPIREPGRAALRTLLGWHLRGHLVVRPGRDPRIVAW